MKHAVTILGLITLFAGVTDATCTPVWATGRQLPQGVIYAQSTTTLPTRKQSNSLSQQAADMLKSGDYQGALESYNQILQLDTNNPDAYVNRGIARFQLGDKRGAIDDFSQALTLNPNNIEAYRQRGGVYLTLGEKRKAKTDFQQAAKIASGGSADDSQTLHPLGQTQQPSNRDNAPDSQALPPQVSP